MASKSQPMVPRSGLAAGSLSACRGFPGHRSRHPALLGDVMPLHLLGEVGPVLDWLESLAVEEKNQRPVLWVMHASALLIVGRLASIPPKLQAAETVLGQYPSSQDTDNLRGHIATIHAFLAVSRHDVDAMQVQSLRALELLDPDNLPARTAAQWTLGHAHALSGHRAEALKAHSEALAISESIGHRIITIMATLGLGQLHTVNNELRVAAETYERLLEQAGRAAATDFQRSPSGAGAHSLLVKRVYNVAVAGHQLQ